MLIQNAIKYAQDFFSEIAWAAHMGNQDARNIVTSLQMIQSCNDPGSEGILIASVEAFQGDSHFLPDGTYIGPTLEDLS